MRSDLYRSLVFLPTAFGPLRRRFRRRPAWGTDPASGRRHVRAIRKPFGVSRPKRGLKGLTRGTQTQRRPRGVHVFGAWLCSPKSVTADKNPKAQVAATGLRAVPPGSAREMQADRRSRPPCCVSYSKNTSSVSKSRDSSASWRRTHRPINTEAATSCTPSQPRHLDPEAEAFTR